VLGLTQLETELELVRGDYDVALARIQQLERLLELAEATHTQDQAKMAEASQQRWAAISALTGGIEMLQHSWHDRSASMVPQSDQYQLYRRCSNELGGLKNTIRRQFGIHPSQAPKTTDELLASRFGQVLLTEPL